MIELPVTSGAAAVIFESKGIIAINDGPEGLASLLLDLLKSSLGRTGVHPTFAIVRRDMLTQGIDTTVVLRSEISAF